MAAQEHPSQTNVNVAPRPAPPVLRAVPPPDPAAIGESVPTYAPSSAALAVAKANQVLWFICGVLELLLVGRVTLRMMGASEAAAFVRFVYGVTRPLVAPFLGMVPNATGTAATRGATLEVPTLIAMVVYFVVFLLLTLFLRLLISRPSRA